MESTLNIIDNSGLIKLKIFGTYNKPFVQTGNFVLCSVKNKKKGKSFLSKYLALITGVNRYVSRKSGIYLKCDKNNAMVLKDKENFLGTKLMGPFVLPKNFQTKLNPVFVYSFL